VLEERVPYRRRYYAIASGQALHPEHATLSGCNPTSSPVIAPYGGSQNPLHYTLRRFGIDNPPLPLGDIDGWHVRKNTNTVVF
jgi:O-acetylhomoserine (thiol)-lyase